jgi:CBS domain-containing protein
MDERTIGAVPVLQGERVMGILTRGDIVRAFVRAGDDVDHPEPRPSAD